MANSSLNTSVLKPETSILENEILINSKWLGAAWIKGISGAILRYSEDLGPADFQTSPVCVVLLITEDDFIADSKVYKTKLAKFYNSVIRNEDIKGTVVVVKSSELTDIAFVTLESFCVCDLGLAIIPIKEMTHLPQLLVLLSTTTSKKKVNPFMFGLHDNEIIGSAIYESTDRKSIETVSTVYGLGHKKSRVLLQQFGSINEIAEKSVLDMTPYIGASSARSVYKFFHDRRS